MDESIGQGLELLLGTVVGLVILVAAIVALFGGTYKNQDGVKVELPAITEKASEKMHR